MWRVVVYDLENSSQRRPWPPWGRNAKKKKLQYDFEASLFVIMAMLHSFSVDQNSATMRMIVCNTAAKRRKKRVVRDVSKVQK